MSEISENQNLPLEKLRYTLSLRLWGNDKVFGPGMVQLLSNIEKYESLRTSTAEMNIAYSKAWTMIKRCEKELGFPIIERKVGGVNGGGSVLTKEGKEFLNKYLAFEKDVKQSADKLFEQYFG